LYTTTLSDQANTKAMTSHPRSLRTSKAITPTSLLILGLTTKTPSSRAAWGNERQQGYRAGEPVSGPVADVGAEKTGYEPGKRRSCPGFLDCLCHSMTSGEVLPGNQISDHACKWGWSLCEAGYLWRKGGYGKPWKARRGLVVRYGSFGQWCHCWLLTGLTWPIQCSGIMPGRLQTCSTISRISAICRASSLPHTGVHR
jgi:hypothetical protein